MKALRVTILLDLFCVTNYKGSDDPPGERNEVYRNLGNFRFAPIDAGALATAPCGQVWLKRHDTTLQLIALRSTYSFHK